MNGPKLRFSEFSGEWEEKKLGQLTKFSKGKNISKDNITGEGTPCVRYGELYTTYKEKIKDPVSKTNLNSDELVFSEENDVIIPTSGETAIDIATVSCIMKDGVAIGGDTTIMKIKGNGLFYSYYLNSRRKKLARLAQGASVVHLYANHLKNFNLNIPSNPEQEKIASFLSKVDIKIEKLEKKQELWETYKKGIMQQIFSQKLRFKNENGENYPDWDNKKLVECSIFVKDGTHGSFKDFNNGVPLLSAKDIDSGKITVDNNPRRISLEDYNLIHRRYNIQEGDVLLTIVGTIGRVAIVKNNKRFALQRSVAIIRPRDYMDSKYLYCYFNSYDFQKSLKRAVNLSAQGGVYLGSLNKMDVLIPSYPEQIKITSFMSSIENKIEMLDKEVKINRKFKKGLLQQMFC